MSRSIKTIIEPQYVIEGAGVLLRRSFGPQRSNLFDPFLLFDHFAFNDPKEGPIVGFPMHPHRGIETVTYILEGSVNHRDSLGNSGLIGPGDVQWMTSGRGIHARGNATTRPQRHHRRVSVVGQFARRAQDEQAALSRSQRRDDSVCQT